MNESRSLWHRIRRSTLQTKLLVIVVSLMAACLAATYFVGCNVVGARENTDGTYCADYQTRKHNPQPIRDQKGEISGKAENGFDGQSERSEEDLYSGATPEGACIANAISRSTLKVYSAMLLGSVAVGLITAIGVIVAALAADHAAEASNATAAASRRAAIASRAHIVLDIGNGGAVIVRNIGCGPGTALSIASWRLRDSAVDPLMGRCGRQERILHFPLAAGERRRGGLLPAFADKGDLVMALDYDDMFGGRWTSWVRVRAGILPGDASIVERGEFER